MTIIGFDFDNTLVEYDEIFHKIAVERGLITDKITANKKTIRDYLKAKEKENEFTIIQGEIYGRRIIDVKAKRELITTLKAIKKMGWKIVVISHKTRFPYAGPKYELHKAALEWLSKNNFFTDQAINIREEDIYFRESKDEKVEEIRRQRCDFYVDDLPEILDMIKGKTTKVLYDPNKTHDNNDKFKKIKNWNELTKVIG